VLFAYQTHTSKGVLTCYAEFLDYVYQLKSHVISIFGVYLIKLTCKFILLIFMFTN